VTINSKQFYQNKTTAKYLSASYQAVVYTSDMSLTSCYSMPSEPESAPLLMTASPLGPAISITSEPVYSVGSDTFIEDHDAYVTLDIVQSALMKVPWCNQEKQSFTVNPIAQANSVFSFETATAD
jgi:hypothetical protein